VPYTTEFLSPSLPVDLPVPSQPTIRLDYTHFSVLLDPARRLAAATAVNIDGSTLRDVPRGDDWHLDPRVAAGQQAGAELYARNDLDRGHLVRRRDPVWGDDGDRANADTFVYTNAAPQAAGFNQSKELWSGLEDYVLDNADVFDRKLSVFTGPVFAENDPVYRGVAIPRRFWKIAAWASEGALRSSGYVLDQSPQLDDIELATALALAVGEAPPLGPFRTFQVPVADIAAITGLGVDVLVAADVRRTARSARGEGWIPIESGSDILPAR
jgi:endonuclease G